MIFERLVKWFAPILPFTMEEVWLQRFKENSNISIHLEDFPDTSSEWINNSLEEKWNKIRDIRSYVTLAIEKEREKKNIRSSLEASPILKLKDKKLFQILNSIDFNEICITSSLKILLCENKKTANTSNFEDYIDVEITKAEGEKCNRCWKYTTSPIVFGNKFICYRCEEVLKK